MRGPLRVALPAVLFALPFFLDPDDPLASTGPLFVVAWGAVGVAALVRACASAVSTLNAILRQPVWALDLPIDAALGRLARFYTLAPMAPTGYVASAADGSVLLAADARRTVIAATPDAPPCVRTTWPHPGVLWRTPALTMMLEIDAVSHLALLRGRAGTAVPRVLPFLQDAVGVTVDGMEAEALRLALGDRLVVVPMRERLPTSRARLDVYELPARCGGPAEEVRAFVTEVAAWAGAALALSLPVVQHGTPAWPLAMPFAGLALALARHPLVAVLPLSRRLRRMVEVERAFARRMERMRG